MPAVNPPVKVVAYILYVQLQSFATPGTFQDTPTLADGDATLIIDGVASTLGAAGSDKLITLPAVTPAASNGVKISLSATEMNGDTIGVQLVDQTATKEWCDLAICIQTTAA